MLSKYIVVILFLFLFFNAMGRGQAVKKKLKTLIQKEFGGQKSEMK